VGDEPVVNDEIVVEGKRSLIPDAQNTPNQVTVIELDGSLPVGGEVADVVGTAAGIHVQRLGGVGDWSTVSIRGSTARQVAVFLDGIPLNPDGAITVNLSELPTTALERIEIYRGHAPAEFDTAPIGGVINLVTPDEPESMGFSVTTGSHSTHRVGANGAASGEVAGWAVDTWVATEGLATSGNYRYFDNRATLYNLFDDRFVERTNNDKNQLNLLGRVRATRDRVSISSTHGVLERTEGIPGPGIAPALGTRLETTRYLNALQVDIHPDWGRIKLQGWQIARDEVWDDRDGEVGPGAQWEARETTTKGVVVHSEWLLTEHWVPGLTTSFRFDRTQLQNLLTNEQDAPLNRRAWSASPSIRTYLLNDQVQINGTMAIQGLHNQAMGELPYDDFSGALRPDKTTLITAMPRGGILWRPLPMLALKANAGRYLRPPDFTELFGDRGSIVGNPELQPERGTQLDVGARVLLDGPVNAIIEVAGFHNRSDNLIAFVQNSQTTMRPINLGQAELKGIEAAARLVFFGFISSHTSATRTWSENQSQTKAYRGNQLPGVPEWEVHQSTSLTLGDWARAGHSLSFTDGNYWDRTNWYRSAPRTIHGVFARVRPIKNGPELEMEVRNLFDHMVARVPRNPLDPEDTAVVLQGLDDFHGYPLAGRTVLFSLRWTG
jgi:outer membrane receptor protein involved in Fe transport